MLHKSMQLKDDPSFSFVFPLCVLINILCGNLIEDLYIFTFGIQSVRVGASCFV